MTAVIQPYIQIKEQALLIRVTCFFWLLTKLLTVNAWLAFRELPTVSFLFFADDAPQWLHTLFFVVSVITLLASVYRPRKKLLTVFIIAETCSVLLDAIRLQPWEYLFMFIVSFYIFFKSTPVLFYRCLLVLLASTYIFSGLHKINGAFLHNVWDALILRKGFGFKAIHPWLHYAGIALGIVETLAGLSLLIVKNKRTSVLVLITMHISILLFLGILLHGHNFSVLPWNVLMVVLLLYISRFPVQEQLAQPFPKFALTVLIIFWFTLPAINFFGYWAHYLSSGMYSGKTPRVYICIKEAEGSEQLKRFYSPLKSKRTCKDYHRILLAEWVMEQTNTAVFPQQWYYSRMYNRLQKKYKKADINMYYTLYPHRNVKEIR